MLTTKDDATFQCSECSKVLEYLEPFFKFQFVWSSKSSKLLYCPQCFLELVGLNKYGKYCNVFVRREQDKRREFRICEECSFSDSNGYASLYYLSSTSESIFLASYCLPCYHEMSGFDPDAFGDEAAQYDYSLFFKKISREREKFLTKQQLR